MDTLSIYWNATWTKAQQNESALKKTNTKAEIAAFNRKVTDLPHLFYSPVRRRWLACQPIESEYLH